MANSGMVIWSLLAEPDREGFVPLLGQPLPEKVAEVIRGAAIAAGAATAHCPTAAAPRRMRVERRPILMVEKNLQY
jgi:hypothetical protein